MHICGLTEVLRGCSLTFCSILTYIFSFNLRLLYLSPPWLIRISRNPLGRVKGKGDGDRENVIRPSVAIPGQPNCPLLWLSHEAFILVINLISWASGRTP